MSKVTYALIFIILVSCGEDNNVSSTKSCAIEGNVYNYISDTLLPNVYIYSEPPSKAIKTDENGNFKINSIRPGDYTLIAEKYEYYKKQINIRVEEGKITPVEFALIPTSINNSPPEKPQLLAPKNNAEIFTDIVKFSWFSNDEDDDELIYDLYLGENEDDLELFESEISDSTFSLEHDFKEGYTYYWKVIVKDLYYSIESDINKFKFVESKEVDLKGLIGYWPLDGDGLDYSGNNHNGEVQNTSFVEDRLGSSNSAAYFNGQKGENSKILIKETEPFDVGSEFSIACWVKQDESMGENSGVGYFECVSRWGGSGKRAASYAIGINKFKKFFLSTYSTVTGNTSESEKLLSTNKWYHLCVSFDSGTANFYIDGEIVDSESGLPIPQESDLYFSIGARPDQLSSFHGVVDEVYLFDRAISSDEVKLIMNN